MKKLMPLIFLSIMSFTSVVYAQTQTGYCPYDPKIVPPKNLGEFSRTFRTFIAEVGTDGTFYIPVGTTAVTGSGTTGRVGTSTARDLSLPMFGWNGSAWVFKPAGSTSAWQTVGSLTPGSMSSYVLNVSGTATGLTGTNTTLNGTTTIDASGVVIANSRSLSPIEVSYLDGLSDFLTTLLAAKQADLGGTYITGVSNDVGTATGAIRIKGTGDIEVLKVGTNLFNINLAGTPTAKPDIKEGGSPVVTTATGLDFATEDFDVTLDGTEADIAVSTKIRGTTSPTADYNLRLDGSGKVPVLTLPTSGVTSVTKTDTFTTSSLTYVDIAGMKIQMSLGSTTSKVFITATISGNAWTQRGLIQLVRLPSTALGLGDSAGSRSVATMALVDTGDNAGCPSNTLTYLDTAPGTLTPSYKLQARVSDTGTLYINRSVLDSNTSGYVRASSTLTGLEIK